MKRPVWDAWYNRVVGGGFDTEEFLQTRRPLPSGRRARDYQRPTFEEETYMEEAFEYLESPVVYSRRGTITSEDF